MTVKYPLMDLHIHTIYSDGTCGIDQVAKTAQAKGLLKIGIADHYSSLLPLPYRMRRDRLNEYLDDVSRYGFFCGIEVDITHGSVGISSSEKKFFDYVLAGIHNLDDVAFWEDPTIILNPKKFVEDMRISLIEAIESGLVDVIVHPTWLPENIRSQTENLIMQDWIESVVLTAASRGVAVEISGRWCVPNLQFVKTCLKHGVKISLGSDAHSPSEIGDIRYPLMVLNNLKASRQDLFIPQKRRISP